MNLNVNLFLKQILKLFSNFKLEYLRKHILVRFFLILTGVIFIVFSARGTTYYVDASHGSDDNNAITPSSPWKTIKKVNESHLAPGDSVLFKKGEIFRGNLMSQSGLSHARIYYGAYGSGVKPRLYGSIKKNLSSDWVNVSGSIWQSSAIPLDVGNVIFDHEAFFGIKVPRQERLNRQGLFWYDKKHKLIKMFSVVNPATFYHDIELALTKDIILETNTSFVTYENLDLRYGGAHGIGGDGTGHILIRNIDISCMGGGYLFGFDTTRYGNGVEFFNSANNNVVEKCTFSQIYDVAMTSQGGAPGHKVFNLVFRNNMVNKCEQSFELWIRGEGSTISGIYFENNTCVNAGFGFLHPQRPDINGTHLLFWGIGNGVTVNGIFIRNNIFYNARNWGIFWNNTNDIKKITIDYNCWFMPKGPIAKIEEKKYDFITQWEQYKNITGQDTHSINEDPLLQGADYKLNKHSPCICAGATLTMVSNDFTGLCRRTGYYDIGAYQYK
jgi:hypothetical protein